MSLFRPAKESPDAADELRDERMFAESDRLVEARQTVDEVVQRGTLLREVPQASGTPSALSDGDSRAA